VDSLRSFPSHHQVRHGESTGNIDECAYVDTADWRIPLSDLGRLQAVGAGAKVKELIGNDGQVFFYVSPYHRARETLQVRQGGD